MFNLLKPTEESILIDDIAGTLSKICRFGGHCRDFYSVAEHLILCHNIAERKGYEFDECRAVFLHDATEAYVGDMVKPLKNLVVEYCKIEDNIMETIGRKFSIDFSTYHNTIKEIDRIALIHEKNILFNEHNVKWIDEDKIAKLDENIFPIHKYSSAEAEYQFRMLADYLEIY